jgi:hypothetical protein
MVDGGVKQDARFENELLIFSQISGMKQAARIEEVIILRNSIF